MTPTNKDFVAYIGTTFGPYILVFNQTKAANMGDAEVDVVNDKILLDDHGLSNGDQIRFTSTGDCPVPLNPGTYYFVISSTTDDFKVSLTAGGSAIGLVNDGSGTLTVYKRGTPVDLTGYEVKAWAQHVENWDETVQIDLKPTVSDGPNGQVQILILDDVTKGWKYGDHVMSLVLKSSAGHWIGPYLLGKLMVRGQPTDPFGTIPEPT